MADAPLIIVRAPAWQALTRRLAAAVARDGRLAPARDSILRPVELLRIMAADALGALGDDVLGADRLRSLLFLAWPYAATAEEARGLLSPTPRVSAAVTALEGSAPQAYEPGVIDHAALVVLALAAARVADRPFAPVFVATIHGLALASSAAEVLGRLDPRQPDASALEVVMETLYVVESARTVTRNELLRPFALDPVERGRWHCLDHLLATSELARRAVSMYVEWDGATSHEIVKVTPRAITPDEIIEVTVTREVGVVDPLDAATVVFASPDGALLAAKAAVPAGSPATGETVAIAVQVPAGATGGWVGFSRADLIAHANKAREGLRAQLAVVLADACVEGVGRIDPQAVIPDYGDLATPRRRGLNRVEGGAPLVTYAAVAPARVAAEAPFSLAWESSGADAVEIARDGEIVVARGEPAGELALRAGAEDGEVALVVTPLRGDARGASHAVTLRIGSPVAITAVEVTQDGSATRRFADRILDVTARLDAPRAVISGQLFLDEAELAPIASLPARPGAVAFTIPAALVHDRMSFTIVVTDPTGARVSVRHGPISLAAVSSVPVVLARPAILDRDEQRIALEDAVAILRRAGSALGLSLAITELPWSDDELAVLVQPPTGEQDPSLGRVLEALAHRALVTPGFEDALWLVMLPQDRDDKRSIARWAPGAAARALAVAGPSAIPRLLAEITAKAAPPGVRARYLALHGTLTREAVRITELRVDERHPGPGAATKTKIDAVSLDSAGHEIARQVVHVLSELRPARIDELVQISDDVAAVELRGPDGPLVTLQRAQGTLKLGVTAHEDAPPPRLAWTWEHDRNARPAVSVLLRRGALATPVLDVDPCHSTAELPLWRYAEADGIALRATDGWNTDEQTVYAGELQRDFTAVVRRLSDGRFFADVPRDASVIWRLDGVTRGRERTLTLHAGETGDLAVEAKRDGVVVRDHRAVRAGEVT